MKRTNIINIGNAIIHIEEDAYESLTSYLNEIKQHFAHTADDFEIVKDIENRIAEMFTEQLNQQQKQVINLEDVEQVVNQMGRVQDFEGLEEEQKQTQFNEFITEKRLFRDTEDRVVAGVCSGIGHYLNVEARWVRLVFFLTVFVGGAGILAYAILWLITPKAVTRADKMSMKGEPVNLQGFKKNFDEEVAAVKDNLRRANQSVQPFIHRLGNFIVELVEVLGRFLNGTGKVIFKVLAIGIVIFGSFLLLGFLVALVAFFGFWDADAYRYFPINAVNEVYQTPLAFAAFLLLFIPVLALVLFSIRVAFNKRSLGRTLSFGLLIVWLGAVISCIYLAAKISSEFKETAEFTQSSELKPYKAYALTLDRSRTFTREDSLSYGIDVSRYKNRVILDETDNPFNMPRNIRLRIEKSDTDKITLTQNYTANGKTFEIALKNAQNIQYDFLQKDSVLNFSPFMRFAGKTNWRNQEVKLTLRVPKDTQLMISGELNRYLEGYNLWDCQPDEHNEESISEWVMTDNGLKCKDEALYRERTHKWDE